MCKLEDKEYYTKIDNKVKLTEKAKNDRKAFIRRKEEKKKIEKILADMILSNTTTFQQTLIYHMEKEI